MKNLKKVLSLVLALAMAASLMTFAFAADAGEYGDYDDITYNEAVDVMTAIGVFNGVGDGTNFDPDGTLTREQAAKIITYMLLGQTQADTLTTVVAPYSDVAATRWSAGAIAYCTNAGIIAGTGDGTFQPTRAVTGLEFAKMLLVALGYDASQEGLEGSTWAINAASLGVAAGLSDGLTAVVMSGSLNREQAAQMAFNTEKAVMVDYSTRIDVTTGDGAVTVTGGRYDRTDVSVTEGNIARDGYLNFAEYYTTDLRAFDNVSDAFGNPATTWNFKGDNIGTYVDDAALTYTEAVEIGDIKKALPTNIDTVSYYTNGTVGADENGNPVDVATFVRTNTAEIGGNGVLTSVFYDYNDSTRGYDVVITSVQTMASEVVDCEKNDDGKYDIDLNDGRSYESDVAYDNETIVLYTWSARENAVQSMAAAQSVAGDTTLVKTDVTSSIGESFTMDGATYEYSAVYAYAASGEGLDKLTANAENLVAYLDSYGYVIYIDEADIADNYAVLLNYNQAWGVTGNTVEVKLLLSDGQVVTVDAKTAGITWNATAANRLVTYTVNSDGIYTLTDAGAYVSGTSATEVNKGVSKFTIGTGATPDTYYADSQTVFFLYDGEEYSAYIGVANVPSLDGAIDGYTVDGSVGAVADAVYLVTDGNIETGTSGELAAFIYKTGAENWYVTSDNDAYYTMKAVVNGEATTLDVNGTAYGNLGTTTLVDSLSVDSANRVTSFRVVQNTPTDTNVIDDGHITAVAKNGVVTIDGTPYTYSSDVTCFVYDKDDEAFGSKSITSLKVSASNTVTAQVDDGVITAIYYVEV